MGAGRRESPAFGTTHADYFHGPVPVTDPLTAGGAIRYEANTGPASCAHRRLDPLACPAVLVAGHAPFCWGKPRFRGRHTAVIVEELAAMAWITAMIDPAAQPIPPALRDKHHFRKHGPTATYGQR